MTKELMIAGEICEQTVADLYAGLGSVQKGRPTKEPVTIYIHSQGGGVDAGFAIYELLRMCASPVITIGVGSVASMAALVLQAGDKRVITPNTTILLHPGSASIKGNLKDVNAAIQDQMRLHQRFCEIVSKRSGKSLQTIITLCGAETYMDAEESLNCGLVDLVQHHRKHVTIGKRK
jgi:ATP-dependent Clp protease protease subunit